MSFRTILRSPLVHFFAIGAAIFAAYAIVDDAPAPIARDEIVLTPEHAERLAAQFAATWNRPPTPAERDGLYRSWALEEAYQREALKLGLDREDPVIRQRLATKMQFLAEAGAGSLEASEAELQAFLTAHPDRFVQQAQLAFDHVLLSGQESAEEIARIRADLQSGADPMTVGRASLLPPSLPMVPVSVIDRQFGDQFRAALVELPVGQWQGPVQSAYGVHLVRVKGRTDARLPDLADIRQRVEQDWRVARAEEMRTAFGEALLAQYRVTLPDPAQAPAE